MSECDQNLSVDTIHPYSFLEDNDFRKDSHTQGQYQAMDRSEADSFLITRDTTGDWEFTVVPCPKGYGKAFISEWA